MIIKETFKCCYVIIVIVTQCYRNTIKIGIEHIYKCFGLCNVDAIEFKGGTNLITLFDQEYSSYSTIFSYCSQWKSLLTRNTSNFGEEVFMPPIDGNNRWVILRAFFSRRRFALMEVNINWVIHGFQSALLYMFLVRGGK